MSRSSSQIEKIFSFISNFSSFPQLELNPFIETRRESLEREFYFNLLVFSPEYSVWMVGDSSSSS